MPGFWFQDSKWNPSVYSPSWKNFTEMTHTKIKNKKKNLVVEKKKLAVRGKVTTLKKKRENSLNDMVYKYPQWQQKLINAKQPKLERGHRRPQII